MTVRAVVVGVGNYPPRSGLSSLAGANQDVKDLVAWLGAQNDVTVTTILQRDTPPYALHADIHAEFSKIRRQFLDTRERQERLYICYTGHGASLGEPPETVLLLPEVVLTETIAHAVGHAYAEWFRQACAFEEVILLMDCCRNVIRQVPPHKLDWLPLKPMNATPTKYLYLFGAASGRQAFEIRKDGVARGLLTSTFLDIVRGADQGIKARQLSDRLFIELPRRAPAGAESVVPDSRLSQNPADDFYIVQPRNELPAMPDTAVPILVVNGNEYAADFAQQIAAALEQSGSPATFREKNSLGPHNAAECLLIPTKRVEADTVRALLTKVNAPQVILIGDRSETDLGNLGRPVRWLDRGSGSPALLAQQVRGIRAAAAFGTARVSSLVPATIELLDAGGAVIDKADTRLDASVPQGRYMARAALGRARWHVALDVTDAHLDVQVGPSRSLHGDAAAEAASDLAVGILTVDAADVPFSIRRAYEDGSPPDSCWPSPESSPADLRSLPPGSYVLRIGLPAQSRDLVVWVLAGWRTEVVRDTDSDSISVRIVRPGSSSRAVERAREALRRALASNAPPVEANEAWKKHLLELGAIFAEDPIGTLMVAAALGPRDGDAAPFIERARGWFGDEGDVAMLTGKTPSQLPVLDLSWGDGDVELGKAIAGRRLSDPPWFAWTTCAPRAIVHETADAIWPEWDRDPDPARIGSMAAVARSFGVPAQSLNAAVRRKSPPIERMERHERLVFVGASNDQIALALGLAFALRGGRRWESIHVWSLEDAELAQVGSDGRSSESVRAARDAAEAQLGRLLPPVAVEARLLRYRGLRLPLGDAWPASTTAEETLVFASLWDADTSRGMVHVSPYFGGDVRTSPYLDIHCDGDFERARYLVEAVGRLVPTRSLDATLNEQGREPPSKQV